jgi:hypothetical protein
VKFKEYLKKPRSPLVIQELFNKPLSFKRQSGEYTSHEYFFEVGDKRYEVKFYDQESEEYPKAYELIFVLTSVGGTPVRGFDTEVITGTGDAIAIFSTIAAIMKDFYMSKKPNIIYFFAKERSRIKLYGTLSKKISSMSPLKNNYITTYRGKRVFINSAKEIDDPFVFAKDI